jgi:hypothetical protein
LEDWNDPNHSAFCVFAQVGTAGSPVAHPDIEFDASCPSPKLYRLARR